MKRTVSSLLTALLLTAVVVGASTAASRVKARHAVKTQVAAAACPVSGCTGPCPLQGSVASVASASKATVTASRGACPVSDPSACPASCRTQASGAVAARVTSH